MAEVSYPSPSHNGRAVTESEYENILAPGTPDGLAGDPSLTPLVYADSSGRQVKIRADRGALVRGFRWASGSSISTVAIAANSSGSTRTDLVVLRLTRSTWNVRLAVVQGAPGGSAPAPTQNDTSDGTGVWELPLATVVVANGTSTLAAGTVTDVAWYIGGVCGKAYAGAQSPASASTSLVTLATMSIARGVTVDLANDRLTVQTPGPYWVHASVEWSHHATGYRSVVIGINGSSVKRTTTDAAVANSVPTAAEVSGLWVLDAGDYVQLRQLHTAGVALALETGTFAENNSLSIHRIGH